MQTTATVYRGSSKNVISPATEPWAVFEFTNRYSIFDWGEMPDSLNMKGESLAMTGALFFELLGKKGIQHHYLGLVDENFQDLAAGATSSYMKVKTVNVHRPPLVAGEYDYSIYARRPVHCLVPLEVIFRWGAPKGSSVLKRHPEIKEGTRFPRPIVEFTTKLEKGDRLLSRGEAMALAGMSEKEMQRLTDLTIQSATHLKDVIEVMGGELWDGKFEWAFTGTDEERGFMMVDAIGLDEVRVTYQGQTLSKEFLRTYYRGSPWEKALNVAKDRAKSGEDFVRICRQDLGQSPEPLSPSVRLAAEMMYLSFVNDLHRLVRGTHLYDSALNLAHWAREFA